jgi:cyclopropane-fatty-acyl-phospholipid synthase
LNIERVAQYPRGATTLEEAHRAKREFVCDKLPLGPGERVLRRLRLGQVRDPRCCTRGTEVVGITLSEPQAPLRARAGGAGWRRRARAGAADRVEIRVVDYRQLTASASMRLQHRDG